MNGRRKSASECPLSVILCRICCSADPKLRRKCISLFDKHNQSLISENINSIADLKIEEGDGLPSKICPVCLLELEAALNFRAKCENSNVLLKAALLYTKIPIQTEPTPVEPVDDIKKEEPVETDEFCDADSMDVDEDTEYHNETMNLAITVLKEPFEVEEKGSKSKANDLKLESEKPDDVKYEVYKSKAIDLKLECNECGGFFKSKSKLSVHWKKVHMYESLICRICARAFKSYKAYNRHEKLKPPGCLKALKYRVERLGKSRIFHCKQCDHSTKSITTIETHYVTHTGAKPMSCSLCSKRYAQKSALHAHQERAHQMYRAETTCQQCGKHLKGRSRIYDHMRQHRSERLQCDWCKKLYKTKNSLIVHLVRHSGVKSYTCEICAKSFYDLSGLTIHRRNVHERGKHIYKCSLCEFKATNSPRIKRHKREHTSTNLPCTVCGIFVEGPTQLQKHQRRHFAVRNYKCLHCEKMFLCSKTRSKHTTRVHKTSLLLNSDIKMDKVKSKTLSKHTTKVHKTPLLLNSDIEMDKVKS